MLTWILRIKKVYIITNLFLAVVYLGHQVGLLRSKVQVVCAFGTLSSYWVASSSLNRRGCIQSYCNLISQLTFDFS